VADQHRILCEAIARWEEVREVDPQGDAFLVAVSRLTQTVGAAAEARRMLSDHVWSEGVAVQVRMGIHTSEP